MLTSFCYGFVFFFKQKSASDMRISDWSSDVCSSDLSILMTIAAQALRTIALQRALIERLRNVTAGIPRVGRAVEPNERIHQLVFKPGPLTPDEASELAEIERNAA